MSDLIGVGVSGLSAYQRALATTSNNIANLQTEGYVRQRTVLAASTQDGSARISIGTGVRFAEVQRMYDQFAEANLQRATSGLEAEKSLLTELQSLQNALGSSEAGLHGAFQDFFDSARELEASPASAGTRAGFLAKAEGLAARFRALASTAASLDDGTRAQMEQAAGETNRFLEQIASLNSQLLKRSSASEQPMQLLDQRDNAIREISERLGITVVIGPSGAANIYAGDSASGAALVENGRARSISIKFDPYDYGKADFVLDAQSQPAPLPVVRSGSMGGLFTFRREGLGTTVNKLDELALAFGRTVNKIHQQGIDSAGRPGEALFYVGPDFVVDSAANGGSARLGVTVADADLVKSASYELKFSAALGKWEVRNKSSGASTTGANEFSFEGLRFSVQGTARDGDTFRVTPDNHPSATIVTLIKDGAQVASAGKLAVRADIGNVSATAAEVRLDVPRSSTVVRSLSELLPSPKEPVIEQSFTQDPKIKIDPYQDTVVAARTGPIAVIPAGYSKLALSTAIDEDSALAVFTRDGRQLSGPKMAATIVDEKYGFYLGATYSDSYLDKFNPTSTVSGAWTAAQRSAAAGNTEKYLIELRKGDQTVVLNLTPAVGATLTAANVDAALAVEAAKTGTGTLAAAGMAFRGKATDGTLAFYSKESSPPFSIAVTNTLSAQRGGFAGSDFSSTTPVTVPVTSYLGLSYSRGVYAESSRQVDVDGRPILTPARLLGAKEVTVASSDYTLLLNGQEIAVNQGDSVDDIRDAINAQTSAVGVTARKADDDGSLILAAHNDVSFDVAEIDTVNEDRASLMINGTEYSAGWRVRISESQLAEKDNFITLNGEKYSFTSLADLEAQLNAKRVSGQAVFGASVAAGKLTLTVKDAGLALQNNNFLKIGANSLGLTQREEYFFETPSSNAVATKLASFINTTKSSVTATKDGNTFTISNNPINAGNSISIGLNTVGLVTQTYFNANAISLDVKPTDLNGNSVSRTVLSDLGFRSGFVMREPLAEDLLIFGVDQQGESTTISLSGTYQAGDPPTELLPDARAYTLEFAGGQYSIIDQETGTVVAAQKFDTTSRTVRYGNWAVTLQAIPSDGDQFTILPNDDAKGDNRVIALIANLQFDRRMLPSGQTAQQEYEDLVNRVGVLTVQTEVGRDAQKVVFDQARESRDRVSGVNLDEELADLLRYQQAYQANAQVIQTASRLFDTLMQRL